METITIGQRFKVIRPFRDFKEGDDIKINGEVEYRSIYKKFWTGYALRGLDPPRYEHIYKADIKNLKLIR